MLWGFSLNINVILSANYKRGRNFKITCRKYTALFQEKYSRSTLPINSFLQEISNSYYIRVYWEIGPIGFIYIYIYVCVCVCVCVCVYLKRFVRSNWLMRLYMYAKSKIFRVGWQDRDPGELMLQFQFRGHLLKNQEEPVLHVNSKSHLLEDSLLLKKTVIFFFFSDFPLIEWTQHTR